LLGSADGSDGITGVDARPEFEFETCPPPPHASKDMIVAAATIRIRAFICIFTPLQQVLSVEDLFDFYFQAQNFRAAIAKPGNTFLYRIELQNVNSWLTGSSNCQR
jgi:hypothetical protein